MKRSILEDALAAIGADADIRTLALEALATARIRIAEDEVDGPAVTVRAPAILGLRPVTRTPVLEGQDPVQAARRRLDLDRLLPPSQRHRVLLTAVEEVGLTLLARPDGKPLDRGGFADLKGEALEAAEAMVLHNLRLAHSVARSYAGQGLEHDDLHASAVMGLLRAVELFDPAAGFKFSTYATYWLRQTVTRAIANESRVIRIPVHMFESVRKVAATRERLTVDGVPPKATEVAEACGFDVPKVIECLRLLPAVMSLETPLGDDGFTLGDLVSSYSATHEHVEVSGFYPEDVHPLLDLLDPRSSTVMKMRFGLSPYDERHTLDEIGRSIGVTRERIRQIEAKAYIQIRNYLRTRGISVPAAKSASATAPGAELPST